MLATQATFPHPASPPPSQQDFPTSMTSTTASLVISPSICPRSEKSSHPLRPPRPKLSLNTTEIPQLRTYGKSSSTSLRLDTLSAISPTVRNTYSNALEGASKSDQDEEVPLSAHSHIPHSSRTPSTSSSISSASTFSDCGIIPYKLSHSLKSILTNSPMPRTEARRMSIPRPLFPPAKHVSFRSPLAEEIKTTIYTTAHSDILPDETDSLTINTAFATNDEEPVPLEETGSFNTTSFTISTSTENMPSSTDMLESSLVHRPPPPRLRRPPHSPLLGFKRDCSSASSSESNSDSDEPPDTPIAGRCKRRREWVWTLGTLPGIDGAVDAQKRDGGREETAKDRAKDEDPISPRTGLLPEVVDEKNGAKGVEAENHGVDSTSG